MFNGSYFGARYFAPRYFPKFGDDAPEPDPSLAFMSRTWVGIGIATILFLMVNLKWP